MSVPDTMGDDMTRPSPAEQEPDVPEAGLGVLCLDAQADGVPCPEVGRECEQCEMMLDRGWREEEGTPTR